MPAYNPGTNYPNTGSHIRTTSPHTGLSTQIVIKVNGQAVGALQNLTVNQARPLERIKEIGTDGCIEIVPNGITTFELTASRIVFDEIRLPEAFSRGFRFINAQRLPFDIEIYDLSNITPAGTLLGDNVAGVVTMTYKNCWFSAYSTPYTVDNYVITETATIQAETAYLLYPTADAIPNAGINGRNIPAQTDTVGIEQGTNIGNMLGSLDASGLVNSIFPAPTT